MVKAKATPILILMAYHFDLNSPVYHWYPEIVNDKIVIVQKF